MVVVVVTPEEVAVAAGLELPLGAGQRVTVEAAITGAMRAVTAHLRRSPTPVQITQRGVTYDEDGWQLKHDPVIEVVSATAETTGGQPSGTYTVVYRAGLDPQADPVYGAALHAYVLAHAAAAPPVARIAPRTIRSVSVPEQSVTYETGGAQAGTGAAGAPPSLSSLDPWRRRGAYQQPGIGPHPLDSAVWRSSWL